jgi:hypothetical protein
MFFHRIAPVSVAISHEKQDYDGLTAPAGCLGMIIWVRLPDIRRVSDLMDMNMGMIFYLWVTPVPDPN